MEYGQKVLYVNRPILSFNLTLKIGKKSSKKRKIPDAFRIALKNTKNLNISGK